MLIYEVGRLVRSVLRLPSSFPLVLESQIVSPVSNVRRLAVLVVRVTLPG